MLGLMTAMPQELDAVLPELAGRTESSRAGRTFHKGDLRGTPVVAVFSRWAKTAAASTATELIVAEGVSRIVFMGVAGALDPGLRVGDVVVGARLEHHDLDASPFFQPGEIPLLNLRFLPTDDGMSEGLLNAAYEFLRDDVVRDAAAFDPRLTLDLSGRRAIRADIASGDRVIMSAAAKSAVSERAPTAACVEMEGAAVAQVCHEHGVAFACVRTISDSADERGEVDSGPFLAGLAGVYTAGILRRWMRRNLSGAGG